MIIARQRKQGEYGLKRRALFLCSGFTLIEIIIVIAISALLLGSFSFVIGSIYTQTDIRTPAGDLEVLAQRVRTIATVHQRTYQIHLREDGLFVLPFGENPKDHPESEWNHLAQLDSEKEPPLRHETIREFHEFEDSVRFFVKGWGMEEFQRLEKDFSYAWQFEPSGMIEPIEVRFEMDTGDEISWLQQRYHPLTGTVTDEEMVIYD